MLFYIMYFISCFFFTQRIVTNDRKEVKDLLNYDEDLNIHQPFSRFHVDSEGTDEGLTPLALAVRQNDLEAVKLILKKGLLTILYMLSCHQFPQEGTNHSLVKQLNGKVDLSHAPWYVCSALSGDAVVQACFVCSGMGNKGWSH